MHGISTWKETFANTTEVFDGILFVSESHRTIAHIKNSLKEADAVEAKTMGSMLSLTNWRHASGLTARQAVELC